MPADSDIPPLTDPVWRALVSGTQPVPFESLSVRVLLTSIRRRSRDPDTAAKCALELRELFVKNAHFPSIQNDLKKLIG